jgi:hypothetical protein
MSTHGPEVPSVNPFPSPTRLQKNKLTVALSVVCGLLAIGAIVTGCSGPNPAPLQQTPTPANSTSQAPVSSAPGNGGSASTRLVTKADVKGYQDLVERSKVTLAEQKDGNAVLPNLVDRINAILNVHLSEDEISASANLVSESGKVGPAALAEMKRSAMGASFKDHTSKFYMDFVKQGEENFETWMRTRGEAVPFEAKFTKAGTHVTEYAYTSNVNLNSVDDRAEASIYAFTAIYAELTVPEGSTDPNRRFWVLAGQPKLVKTDKTVPNPA